MTLHESDVLNQKKVKVASYRNVIDFFVISHVLMM